MVNNKNLSIVQPTINNYKSLQVYGVVIKKSSTSSINIELSVKIFELKSEVNQQVKDLNRDYTLNDFEMRSFSCNKHWIGDFIYCSYITRENEVGMVLTNSNDKVIYYTAQSFFDFQHGDVGVIGNYTFTFSKSLTRPLDNILFFKRTQNDTQPPQLKGENMELLYGSIREVDSTYLNIKKSHVDSYVDFTFSAKNNSQTNQLVQTLNNVKYYVCFSNGLRIFKYEIVTLGIYLNNSEYNQIKQMFIEIDYIDRKILWKLDQIFMPAEYSTEKWLYIILVIFSLLIPIILCWVFCCNKTHKKREIEFREFREKHLDQIISKKDMEKKIKKKKKEFKESQVVTEEGQKTSDGKKKKSIFAQRQSVNLDETKKKGFIKRLLTRNKLEDIDENKDYGFLEIME